MNKDDISHIVYAIAPNCHCTEQKMLIDWIWELVERERNSCKYLHGEGCEFYEPMEDK